MKPTLLLVLLSSGFPLLGAPPDPSADQTKWVPYPVTVWSLQPGPPERLLGHPLMLPTGQPATFRVLLTRSEMCHARPDKEACERLWDNLPDDQPPADDEAYFLGTFQEKTHWKRANRAMACAQLRETRSQLQNVPCQTLWEIFLHENKAQRVNLKRRI